MMSISTISESLSFALVNEVISVKDIIMWSDKVISENEAISYSFIELSLSSKNNIDNIKQLLNNIIFDSNDSVNTLDIIVITLGLLNYQLKHGNITHKQATLTMYQLTLKYETDEFPFLNWFDDEYDLAVEGILEKSLEDVKHEIETYLKDYAPPKSLPFIF